MMDANRPLEKCINAPEADLDLARACLLIAKAEYPNLSVDAYLDQVDRIATAVGLNLGADKSPQGTLAAINRTLFQEQGFCGNAEDYYDPRNSFLNDVLDRRMGIPITLSILYMEVGYRLGLGLQGVSFPGHFLVKLPLATGDLVVDPFFSGSALNEVELTNRIVTLFGAHPPNLDLQSILAGVSKKEILARMLRNLKNIYLQKGDFARALSISNQLMIITPESASEIRDRGLILEYLECTNAALHDYQRYLDLAPQAQDRQAIRGRLLALHNGTPTVH